MCHCLRRSCWGDLLGLGLTWLRLGFGLAAGCWLALWMRGSWLAEKLAGWLVGREAGWLAGWLAMCLAPGWLAGCVARGSIATATTTTNTTTTAAITNTTTTTVSTAATTTATTNGTTAAGTTKTDDPWAAGPAGGLPGLVWLGWLRGWPTWLRDGLAARCKRAAVCQNVPKSIQFASPPAGSPFNVPHMESCRGLAFRPNTL